MSVPTVRSLEVGASSGAATDDLELALQYVRVDGDPGAPVCFLTIEEGGKWPHGATAQTVRSYFQTAPQIEPHPQIPTVGRQPVSEFMARLMVNLFPQLAAQPGDWMQYRRDHLHRRNECNIKFYPLARKNPSEWAPLLSSFTGVTYNAYLDLCRDRRPGIIKRRHPATFESANQPLHIILAARTEWLLVLDPRCRAAEVAHESSQWIIYRTDSGQIFAYYNMWSRTPGTDAMVTRFTAALPPLVSPEIVSRLAAPAQSG